MSKQINERLDEIMSKRNVFLKEKDSYEDLIEILMNKRTYKLTHYLIVYNR